MTLFEAKLIIMTPGELINTVDSLTEVLSMTDSQESQKEIQRLIRLTIEELGRRAT